MPIITSILDNDLYKFTMQKAVLGYKPGVPVRYVFSNRRPEGKFNASFMAALQEEIHEMRNLRLTDDEAFWLENMVPYLGQQYVAYLRNYRYQPSEVTIALTENNELDLEINGPWGRTILWEVPLMALISELYFRHCDTNWTEDGQREKAAQKADWLKGITFSDFGTRRRRSYHNQRLVVETMLEHARSFVGTSNVHFSYLFGLKPKGTMAHEWIMGISALESLRHANYHALKIWSDVFGGNLGIALTDTFGTDVFFQDFDPYLSRLFDGVRHDSGNPIKFGHKTIEHYQSLQIPPKTKSIIFSDGLDCSGVVSIYDALREFIGVAFGIGTHFTNDYQGSPALNMVIKMWSCNGVPVVKLSDVPTKQIGERDALRVARWTFFGTPLDSAV